MRIQLYIQGQRVKMFDKDETIKINRKVKDYRDIEKIFSDYSESFTVPGEANNTLFKHYYDADVDGSFDARIKQPAQIYVDQELFKDGVIQLKSVQIKNNKVDNYKIQFFTQLTQLVETFGEDELNDLDFTAYNYEYTYNNVKTGLTGGLFGGDIIYPLISYKRRFIYESPNNSTDTDTIVNINGLNIGIDYKELKPAIKVNRVFEAIEVFYTLNFTGSIFNSIDLEKMYINLVNKKEESQSLTTDTPITGFASAIPPPNLVNVNIVSDVTPKAGFEDTEFIINHYINDVFIGTSGLVNLNDNGNPTNDVVLTTTTPFTIQAFSYKVEVQSSEPFEYDIDTVVNGFFDDGTIPTLDTEIALNRVITPTVIVKAQFQEFKVKDFVKAFVKAFNLVVIPLSETEILFEPLQDWYRQGKIIDLTQYTDNQDLEVKPGELISGIDFKYEKNETFLSAVFKENNNRGFGNLEEEFFDPNGEKLSGDLLEVSLPFEKPIFEKISPNTVYGFMVNREQEEFLPFHSIFYVKEFSGNSINIKDDVGTIESINEYLCPVTSENPQASLATNFEIEIDEFELVASTITFYTKYWSDYVNDLFSIRRRNYNLEARLPLQVLRTINLNDRLLIGQRRYIINSYQADLMTQEVKLDLFNDIFSGDLNTESEGALLQRSFVVNNQATDVEYTLRSQYEIDTATTDIPAWKTLVNGNIAEIQITENRTGQPIFGTITITDTEGNILTGYVTQLNKSISADTNLITADSTLITADYE